MDTSDSGPLVETGDTADSDVPDSFEEMAAYAFAGEWEGSQYVGTPSALGDVDGDGRADLILGAAGEATSTSTDYGEMYIVLGGALDSLPGMPTQVPLEDASYSLNGLNHHGIGFSVAVVGDTDGDGLEDFVTGAPEGGLAYLIRGGSLPAAPATVDLDADADMRIEGEVGRELGRTVGAAGDVDGDGLDDFLVGEPAVDWEGDGVVYLFAGGGAGGLDYTADDAYVRFTGGVTLGWGALGAVGDIDGDGVGELLLADPYVASEDTFYLGAVYLYAPDAVRGAGNVSIEDASLVIRGSYEYARLSSYSARIADRDGDGLDELLLAGEGVGEEPMSIWSGATLQAAWGSGAALVDVDADLRSDWAVYSAFNVGDVDGGGQDDLVLGYGYIYSFSIPGQLALMYGEDLPASGTLDYDAQRFLFEQDASEFEGFGVAGGRDVNGDGVDDYLVSVPELADSAGLTWLIFGG